MALVVADRYIARTCHNLLWSKSWVLNRGHLYI